MRRRSHRAVALIGGGALFVQACGGSSDSGTAGTTVPVTSPATGGIPTTVSATTTSSTTTSSTSTTTTSTTTTSTTMPAVSTTLPGTPIDWLIAGTAAQVAGVAWNETISIRAVPGDDRPAVAELAPLTELVLTGAGREIATERSARVWAEVEADGGRGWISMWSLVYLGAPRDLTVAAIDLLGGRPTAPTMLELAELVIAAVAPIDPDSNGARAVRATEPSAGPAPEIVYDVFPGEDFGDDAAAGARYRIVGKRLSSGAVELVHVEARSLCTRGVDRASGVCI